MAAARDNLDALTGLRFVAAFTIVLGHTYMPWLEVTAIGMPLFFTLSGFIIHYVYADAFAGGWRLASRQFAVARFSRIYPLYLALLIYSVLRGPMGPPLMTSEGLPVLLAYLTGSWTWWPHQIEGNQLLEWYYHISWSVSTEIFFYFSYAAVFFRISGLKSARSCLVILLMFCVASYAIFYVAYLTRDLWEAAILRNFPQFTARTVNFNDSFYRWLLYVSPYSRIFEFIGGCLTCQLYRLLRRGTGSAVHIPVAALAWSAVAVAAILFALFRYFGEFNPWLAQGNHSLGGFIVSLHMNFLFAPACYAMILALALGGSTIGTVLSSRICCFLGDISYSTYLSHPNAERVLLHTGLVITATWAHVLVMLTIIYVVSWVLYSIVEVPAKRGLRQLLTPRRLAVAAPGGGA
jgi:peptidoglycan/LPS O-acetylase OafA/YrhL